MTHTDKLRFQSNQGVIKEKNLKVVYNIYIALSHELLKLKHGSAKDE